MKYVVEGSEEVWIFRKNLRPRVCPADEHFRYVAYITFHYEVTGPRKLPSAAEMTMFADLEEELVGQEENEFILTGVATKAGVRDFLIYTSDPESVQRVSANLMDRFADYEVQLEIAEDPDWLHYLEFPGDQDAQ